MNVSDWAGALLTSLFSLGMSVIIGASALEDGRLTAATDRTRSVELVVESTREIPKDRVYGLFDGWYAIGQVPETGKSGWVPISRDQYLSLTPGDTLQVHETTLDKPHFLKAETVETSGEVYSVFGTPFTWPIFLSLFLLLVPGLVFWAAWRRARFRSGISGLVQRA